MSKSQRPLAVGDRVRVFSHFGGYNGTVIETGVESDNRYTKASGLVLVKSDRGETWRQHPRQCVRLKPRKEPQEERLTLNVSTRNLTEVLALRSGEGMVPIYACGGKLGKMGGCVLLTELREGERIFSKDQIGDAWGNMGSSTLYELLRCLGFYKEKP